MSASDTQQPKLEDILWMGINSSPGGMAWCASLGTALQALIVGSILVQTVIYYEAFGSKDRWFVLLGVAAGTTTSVVIFIISSVQTSRLIHYTPETLPELIRFDQFTGLASMFLAGMLAWFTTGFYAWRAWRLSGRKIWLVVPLSTAICANIAITFAVLAYGCQLPEISMANLVEYGHYTTKQMAIFRCWGAVYLGVDAIICALSLFFLVRNKTSMFYEERRIFRKVVAVILETMMPPVICLIVLVSSYGKPGNPLGDYQRVFILMLEVLYYHSLVYSLVARKNMRSMVDSRFINSSGAKMIRPDPISPISPSTLGEGEKGVGLDTFGEVNSPKVALNDGRDVVVGYGTESTPTPSLVPYKSPLVQVTQQTEHYQEMKDDKEEMMGRSISPLDRSTSPQHPFANPIHMHQSNSSFEALGDADIDDSDDQRSEKSLPPLPSRVLPFRHPFAASAD